MLRAAVFVLGLVIVVVSVVGMVAPSVLLRVASRFDNAAAWYGMAIVRLSLAALLFAAAKGSRSPMLLRVVACVPLLAGLGALATPIVGVDRAQAAIAAWSRQGDGVVRLTGIVLLALGGAMAYPCAPRWRRLRARPRDAA